MSNLGFFVGEIVGIIGFLFLIWRRLREDYTSDRIFTFGIVLAICLLAASVSQIYWFWLSFVFLTVGLLVLVKELNLRFFESLEAVATGFLLWFLTISLIEKAFLLAGLQLVFILLFYFLDKRYKRFTWYKSGKVGFAGLVILTLFFIVRMVIAIFVPDMLSFVGKFEAIADVTIAFIFFAILFKLSDI